MTYLALRIIATILIALGMIDDLKRDHLDLAYIFAIIVIWVI